MLFAMIGSGGFIAPKHLQAIRDTGHFLDCSFDIHDSVGVLDEYFAQSEFFTDIEDFEEYIEQSKNMGKEINYLSVCTPTHTHFDYIRFGLKYGMHVICEKPLILDPSEIQELKDLEVKYQKRVFCLLPLRLHCDTIALKEKIQSELEKNPSKVFDITLTYISVQGKWYFSSWRADVNKSGGLATHMGISIFDALIYLFGGVKDKILNIDEPDRVGGILFLEHAKIRWFFSINPEHMGVSKEKIYRRMIIEGEEVNLTQGFDNLHTESYKQIVTQGGFGLDDALASLKLAYEIRGLSVSEPNEDSHVLCCKKTCE
ncbi:Gfo/Idh/MocA family protein [Helicobacter acinonychis]|uniref:Lipopolysaccharide biosynthesis protein wbpB n=1 Tax=Helicobacter acinonychis (strain Sheeba) TaxID=382638 RepID=Q17XI3_HELAH|nr:Gfo/Idh/MocA family oxidoreductase [Helicobacter acinonychis]CAJ99643.1 lipopolysaccharide biosynthesis protein wbpB [Helicobacter acinonychis str. Sheeba]STP04208.1 lipopolysaccharide biosynthesis protein wbpB [Helicobacter acinonychis]